MTDKTEAADMVERKQPATAGELAVMLSWVADMAYSLTLGSVPPWMTAAGKRMRDPRPGDLVMETTTQLGRGGYPAEMRIGHLLREAREPAI